MTPMRPLTRLRVAAHLAWTTLATGIHPTAAALIEGSGLGMDIGAHITAQKYRAVMKRQGTGPDGSGR
jgi:hypothetical protein